MKWLCQIFGHKLENDVTTVHSFDGPLYRCRICRRCGKRIPLTPEDARKKAAKNAEVANVMNAARAQYGMGPRKWED